MAKTKPKNSKDRFAKIYREFSRVRYSKYKLQFPRIRQSEIIAKIIKEWEAMDQNAKQNMAQEFIQKSGKGFLQDTPPSSDKKDSKQKKGDKKKSQPLSSSARQAKSPPVPKKKKKPSPKMRVFVQKGEEKRAEDDYKRKQSEGSKSPGKKSTPQKKQSSSSKLAIKQKSKSSRKISKTPKTLKGSEEKVKNAEYVNFYKYYHDRLRVEHPRWSTAQITTIIKLLWRKRNLASGRKRKDATAKGLTGRQLYNRTKQSEGFLKEQIKLFWKALPHESKKYWQIKGQGRPNRSKRDSGRFVRKVLNAGVSKQRQQSNATEPQSTFNWMNNPIQ